MPSRASLMLQAFIDPVRSNCSFLEFYVLSIQWLETRSTVDKISFALGGSVSVQLPLSIKGFEGVPSSLLTNTPVFRTSQSLLLQHVLTFTAVLLKIPSSFLPVSARFFFVTLH